MPIALAKILKSLSNDLAELDKDLVEHAKVLLRTEDHLMIPKVLYPVEGQYRIVNFSGDMDTSASLFLS